MLVADLFILTGAVALGVHLNLESPEPNGTYWYPVTAADNITVEPLSKDTSLHPDRRMGSNKDTSEMRIPFLPPRTVACIELTPDVKKPKSISIPLGS